MNKTIYRLQAFKDGALTEDAKRVVPNLPCACQKHGITVTSEDGSKQRFEAWSFRDLNTNGQVWIVDPEAPEQAIRAIEAH